MKKETLQDWKDSIESEVGFVNIKPFSHNIISISLRAIAKEWGEDVANEVIDEFGLEELGWKKGCELEEN